jgi:hypothetical protein
VEAFWAIQNPTTRNRRGLDSGRQYRGQSSPTPSPNYLFARIAARRGDRSGLVARSPGEGDVG